MRQWKDKAPLVGLVFIMMMFTVTCATGGKGRVITGVLPAELKGEPEGEYDRVKVSCGSPLGLPSFSGRVVYRERSGKVRPLLGVRFILRTHGTVHSNPNGSEVTIAQDDEGRFDYRFMSAAISSDTVEYYRDGQLIAWKDVEDSAAFTLEAAGCQELRVDFDETWQPKTLELECPGKS